MKHNYLKSLFLMLMMCVGMGAWGEDADYTLTPTAGSNNTYTDNCDVTVDGITWNITGNATMVPWRLGGKSITKVDRTVYSKTAYTSAVSKVDLTVGAASSITVNSLKLVYSTNADFSNSSEISKTFAENSTISFELENSEFPANAYYKFVFNVTVSGSSNKFVEFSKVEFYNTTGGGSTPELTPYTVTFNAGTNGTCTTESLTEASVGSGVTLPSCTANTNYTFQGWSTSSSATSADAGAAGGTYHPSSDCTLYAYYTYQAPSHDAKFFVNGQQYGETQSVAEGSAIAFPTEKPSIDDVVFIGWTENEISGTQDAAPALVSTKNMGNADANFYAVFATKEEGDTQWKKVAASKINSAGIYAIITTDGHAFNGTISSGHGQVTSTAFSFDANGIATSAPEGTCEITFTAVTGGYTMYNANNGYLYASAASSGKLAWHNTESSYWLYKSSNWLYNSNSAYLRDYQNSSIRTYGANNGSVIQFAKKESATIYSDYCTSVITKTLLSITVKTAPSKVDYIVGEIFDPAGLVITATYDNESTEDVEYVSNASAFTFSPSLTTALTIEDKNVIITYKEKAANQAITVNAIPEKTIAEFIASEGGKCYLTGTVSNIADTTYGNFDLTDESGTIYIYGCLNAAGEAKKFAELDVVAGDKIKVLAETYEYFNNTTHEAKNVIFVEEIKVEKPKYTVTIETPENGTFEVKNGKTTVTSGDQFEEGETLNVTLTPAEGYRVKNWQAIDTSTHTYTSATSYTMTANDVTLKANFELIPTYTIAWSVNGEVVKSDDLKEGAAVTAPEVGAINGKVFTGWVTTETVDADATPSYVTPTTAEADITYYAVFGSNSGTTDAKITWFINGVKTPSSGGNDVNTALTTSATNPSNENGIWTAVASKSYAATSSQKAQLGSGSYKFAGTITLSGSSIPNNATITNITVTATSSATDANPYTISAKVNENTFGQADNISSGNPNCSWSDNVVGNNIVLTTSCGYNKNIIISEISVSYIHKAYSDFTTTPSTLVLDENANEIAEIYDEYDKVVVKRTIKANTWSTLCLPFAMNADQIAANFGEDAEVKVLTGLTVNGTSYTMNFDDCDEIGAALPCMIRVSKPISEIVVEGKVEVNTTEKSEDTAENGDDLITFVGSYTKSSVAPNDGNYIISSNKFYYVDSTVTNKGFRGYFNLFTLDAAVKSLSMSFDNDADAIQMVENKKYDTKIFNLKGQRVDKAQKGIYIINGRKVVK